MKRIVFLRADLKETNRFLERIAIALELGMGISQPGVEAKDSDRNVEAMISTEADLIREEWNQAVGEPPAEEDTEPDSPLEIAFRRFSGK